MSRYHSKKAGEKVINRLSAYILIDVQKLLVGKILELELENAFNIGKMI